MSNDEARHWRVPQCSEDFACIFPASVKLVKEGVSGRRQRMVCALHFYLIYDPTFFYSRLALRHPAKRDRASRN